MYSVSSLVARSWFETEPLKVPVAVLSIDAAGEMIFLTMSLIWRPKLASHWMKSDVIVIKSCLFEF